MIGRYLSSAAAGLAITTSLLWVMNTLIEISEEISTPRTDIPDLVFLPTIDDTEPLVEQRKPDPVDPPAEPPPLVPPRSEDSESGIPILTAGPTPPPAFELEQRPFGYTDGALINIIHGKPEYPISLAQRGIEGYVIVEFDVNALGVVENVRVIESTHSGFNKAAIRAAYRSKYKPKVVDGTPLPTQGVQKLFRFEMEE